MRLAHVTPSGVTSKNPHTLYAIKSECENNMLSSVRIFCARPASGTLSILAVTPTHLLQFYILQHLISHHLSNI